MRRLRSGLSFLSISTAILLALAVPAPSSRAHDGGGGGGEFRTNEVLIKLQTTDDLAAVAARYRLAPVPIKQFGSRPIFRMTITDGIEPDDKADELVRDDRVVYAEPNYVGQTPEERQRSSWAVGTPQTYQAQWAHATIRLETAHAITKGAGVTVAVLDTGVDHNHPALVDHLIPGYDFVDMDADPSEVEPISQSLSYGHGTHVAGLVAMVAPEAKIMPLRVLDADGAGNLWVLAEALRYALNPDGDVATDDGADVINLSLSTFRRTQLLNEIVGDATCEVDDDLPELPYRRDSGSDDDHCQNLSQTGAVVVMAAGNSGSNSPEYPAAEDVSGAVAVGASTLNDRRAAWSNFGSWIDLLAPGEGIVSSVPGNSYGAWSGTSMAAPLVAGTAALVRSAFPQTTPQQVTEQIGASAVELRDSSGSGSAPLRLDTAAALRNAQQVSGYRLWLPVVIR